MLIKNKQLTREQRFAIYLGIQEGKSQKAIARQIGVHPSTVSLEIGRNRNRYGLYPWRIAQENSVIRRERAGGNRRVDANLLREVLSWLEREDWSPRQISGYLALSGKRISHETIYRHIRSDESGILEEYRRHRKFIHDRVSIHEQPLEADGRRFGDWEMDLSIGKGQKSAILTLCERSCNFLLMVRAPEEKSPEGVNTTAIQLLQLRRRNVLSITIDNGSEFSRHGRIAKALDTKVFFVDSYASWQKGAIENTNKLIRQNFPRSLDSSLLSDQDFKNIQYKINWRLREKLDFNNPKNVFCNLIL